MALQLYNTLGRKREDFIPIKPLSCGLYGCGPTVYNYAHIGNLRAYVFLDTLDRALRFLGYDITHVMNITDIGHLTGDSDDGEDKMLTMAKKQGQSVLEVAEFYTKAFFRDIDKLNIRRPDIVCKATEHIDDMINLIKRLEEKGHTYIAGGNVYYDISTFADYGKLADINLDDLKAGARITVDENKRNPHDFVLWFTKSKFENQALVWDSPWGVGYPGWHLECSAMSMKYLGEHFDIHTGGIDHIPIHHTNEIAQSEGATGKKWVNYWLHNEFLVIAKDKTSDSQKMSKSSGDFLTLDRLIEKGYDPLDYRFFLLSGHYRSQLAFSWDAMESAKNSGKTLVQRLEKVLSQAIQDGFTLADVQKLAECENIEEFKALPYSNTARDFLNAFTAAIEDDLATPRALSQLQTAIKNKEMRPEEIIRLVAHMDVVLGLKLIERSCSLFQQMQNSAKQAHESTGDAEIDSLVAQRIEAKKQKDYVRADEIRSTLKDRGIILTDTPQGTTWTRVKN